MNSFHALLTERVLSIPSVLDAVLKNGAPSGIARITAAPHFVITGGGFSEGPARTLVALLNRHFRERGSLRTARYVPLSTFAAAKLPSFNAALILFSQGLAPNARLPLAHLDAFSSALVFTSVGPQEALRRQFSDRGVIFWQHPPAREDRLLVRVVGPAAALACGLLFLSLFSGSEPPANLSARYAEGLFAHSEMELFGDARRPIAFVGGDALCELLFPLRWKLLEGLRVPDPPVWDLMQVVHGPLQSFYESPITLLGFEQREAQHEAPLFSRLASLLDARRHRLLRLQIDGADGVSLLYADAILNAAFLRTLKAHPLKLDDWPLRGADGALYAIDTTFPFSSAGDSGSPSSRPSADKAAR